MKTLRLILMASCLMFATTPFALPPVQVSSDTDDDATLTLRLYTSAVADDSTSFCQVEVVITDENVEFTNGDSFSVSVFEDDLAGDDLIFELIDVPVTVGEVAAGRVDRILDCSSLFPNETGDSLQIYATAVVTKDACGSFCVVDRPKTGNIDVLLVGDDDLEDNDTRVTASNISIGLLRDLISVDADWYSFSLSEPSNVTVRVYYQVLEGRIDGLLENDGVTIALLMDGSDGGVFNVGVLVAGDYRLMLINRVAGNTVFYDFEVSALSDGVFADSFEDGP